MSDIKIGRIYKIICTQSDHVYVGSTFNTIRDRFHGHKGDYAKWMKGKYHDIAIFPYFKQEYSVVDRAHLEAYEQLWISKLTCVNKNNPIRIDKLSKKAYYEANKEKHKIQMKTYRETNKEVMKEYNRAYHEANKERLNGKLNKKVNCGCGGKYTHGARVRHTRTKKHIAWQAIQ
ncbi:TPA: hypothetical protein N0F65_004408 [Lagenidium giganteum]|uniref:GIY-YIG domain-containing protein n=1 Tax=Lagenidium giganteum TaxID=4803 RepID=A0AAV2ZF85_9STRA|nr:TPA: hypothetical protein N0F65_004408 [Lagenidium giganteum]